MNTTTLILTGFGDSDPGHWQSRWEVMNTNFVKVQQRDWDHPVCNDWIDTLDKSASQINGEIILVAHSLGCLLVAHWAARTHTKVKGALLVAPPDSGRADFPEQITGFHPFPLAPFNFPSIVVASSDDPYGDLLFSEACATAWGSRFVNIGSAGHINTKSGFGAWPEGLMLHQQLVE